MARMKKYDAVVIEDFYTPQLHKLISHISECGPSPDEYKLMGILAIFDETLRSFAQEDSTYAQRAALQTYKEIEEYIQDKFPV